jgi:hypothetical protein
MAGVDARIVLVGLPTIAQQLHAGVADVIWVSQAYLFASTLRTLAHRTDYGSCRTGEDLQLWLHRLHNRLWTSRSIVYLHRAHPLKDGAGRRDIHDLNECSSNFDRRHTAKRAREDTRYE